MDEAQPTTTPAASLFAGIGAIVVYFLIQLATGVVVGIAYAATHVLHEGPAHMQALLRDPHTKIVLTVIILPIACVLSVLLFRAWFARQWRAAGDTGIGLRRTPLPAFAKNLLIGMLVLVAGGLLTKLVARGHLPDQDIHQVMQHASLAWQIGLGLSLVTLVPLAEEILFRGILLPSLARYMPIGVAVGVDAVLFALVHLPDFGWRPEGLPALALVGGVCCWRRLKTGSLYSSIAVHAGNNLLAILITLATVHH